MTTAAGLTTYGYDNLSQLTSVAYPGGRHVTYTYDALGNRTVVNDTGTNAIYSADALNQYTQAGGTSCGYDADGNMTSRTDASGTTTYQYDAENRLISVSSPTNGISQFIYDALGNRTMVVNNGVTNQYVHDPIGLVDVAAEYDGNGGLVARYDYANGLVSMTDAQEIVTSTLLTRWEIRGKLQELLEQLLTATTTMFLAQVSLQVRALQIHLDLKGSWVLYLMERG